MGAIGRTWGAALEQRSAQLAYTSRYSNPYISSMLEGTGGGAGMILLIVDERMGDMRFATTRDRMNSG
jgi:hypothetical protein